MIPLARRDRRALARFAARPGTSGRRCAIRAPARSLALPRGAAVDAATSCARVTGGQRR